MTYLDELAIAIQHEVDPTKLPNEDTAPLFRLYAVLLLAKGVEVTVEDVHNAWSAWMIDKDPLHQSIRPFADLSPDVQREDQPYVDAIRSVANRRSGH